MLVSARLDLALKVVQPGFEINGESILVADQIHHVGHCGFQIQDVIFYGFKWHFKGHAVDNFLAPPVDLLNMIGLVPKRLFLDFKWWDRLTNLI